MKSLWIKIDSYLAKNDMIAPGDTVLAAVSGGVDSMCMLHYLIGRKEKMKFDLAVFHFNHHLREEATRDADFVRNFCEKQGIPCYIAEGLVQEEAANKGLSIEEAARKLRYAAMFDRATSIVAVKESDLAKEKRVVLAFAHNAGDRAETVLFRMFRGTGLKGIRGIEAVSSQKGYKIIRPLLECSRRDIEDCMEQLGGDWVEDKSNWEDDYSRNKIRHHILPYANKYINSRSIENICRAAIDASEAYEYIVSQTKAAYDKCIVDRRGRRQLEISDFLANNPYIQKHILLYLLEEATEARKDLTWDHVEDMLRLIKSDGNKSIDLPYGLKAIKEYNYFYLENRRFERAVDSGNITGEAEYLSQELEIRQKLLDYDGSLEIPNATYTKWLDYDRIQNRIEIRNRRQGDYLYVDDKGNRVSLKKYFINEKIPPSIRDEIILVTDGSHVLWVVGYRISAAVKVTANTRKILELEAVRDNQI